MLCYLDSELVFIEGYFIILKFKLIIAKKIPTKLIEDILELKPTTLIGVPRIWKKIQEFSEITNKKNIINWKMKFILSGSAPLDSKLAEFLRSFFKCPILQGYGLTECAAAATLSEKNDLNNNHVGIPLCDIKIKLIDVPELNYFCHDKPYPRGEILIYGPNVFKGYFKDEKLT